MVFVIGISLLIVESQRNKHKCDWPEVGQLFIDFDEELDLTGLFEELFHFMLHVPSKAINTKDFTPLLAIMKFRA